MYIEKGDVKIIFQINNCKNISISIILKLLIFTFIFFFPKHLSAKFCAKEDYINYVSDFTGCIAITIHRDVNTKESLYKKKIVFFIHGDQIEPKVTYFDNFVSNFSFDDTVLISITRPGWINKKNNKSDGKKNISNGDNYIPNIDVDPIYRTIKKIKKKFNSKEIIIVGHSGGAAITGILFGRFNNIVNEAILISCPCIVPLWRKNYAEQLSLKNKKRICIPKYKSKSPHEYVKKIDSKIKINIFVGEDDKNTLPLYSYIYHSLLDNFGKKTHLKMFSGDHTSVLKNQKMIENIRAIISKKK